MDRKDIISALFILGIGFIMLLALYHVPVGTIHAPGSAFFPLFLTILLILASLVLLYQALKVKKKNLAEQERFFGQHWKKLIPAAAGLIVYAFLLKPVGYVLCTVSVLILFAKLQRCSWMATLMISILCTLLSSIIFWFMKIPLPVGITPFL